MMNSEKSSSNRIICPYENVGAPINESPSRSLIDSGDFKESIMQECAWKTPIANDHVPAAGSDFHDIQFLSIHVLNPE
jgi:hypothetical protein